MKYFVLNSTTHPLAIVRKLFSQYLLLNPMDKIEILVSFHWLKSVVNLSAKGRKGQKIINFHVFPFFELSEHSFKRDSLIVSAFHAHSTEQSSDTQNNNSKPDEIANQWLTVCIETHKRKKIAKPPRNGDVIGANRAQKISNFGLTQLYWPDKSSNITTVKCAANGSIKYSEHILNLKLFGNFRCDNEIFWYARIMDRARSPSAATTKFHTEQAWNDHTPTDA